VKRLDIVFLGLSITSAWGNGHATTYRALLRELARRGHGLLFLERDVPWYADHRDLPRPPYCRTNLYHDPADLDRHYRAAVADADAVVVGSFVPDGIEVGRWVQRTARGLSVFYDIDTPVTLAALAGQRCTYLSADLMPGYDLYLSFTGGPTLRRIEREFGSPRARALYCSVDPRLHEACRRPVAWDLGYLGTYSPDRQLLLEALLLDAARRWPEGRFVVAGAQFPDAIAWPDNVERSEHVVPARHAAFFGAQRFTLNITRDAMRAAGWSPSVRLFEAAAAGAPVISDRWPGLESFFEPGREILLADTTDDVLDILQNLPERERLLIANRARDRVLSCHTGERRAEEFEAALAEAARGVRDIATRIS
jgi:spore maturation protein CgeB